VYRRISLYLAFAAALSLTAAPAFAQKVRDLSGDNLTSGNLIHVLTPKGPRPRGLSLEPPKCTRFQKQEQASRGLELAPKADIAALDVEFEVNSAILTPAAEKTLDTLGQALSSAELKPCCFEVRGYTDATGGASYNQKLSTERAQSVIAYLSARTGIDKERMMPKGFGKSRPVASNATEAGRQKNRRVQVVNLGYGAASD